MTETSTEQSTLTDDDIKFMRESYADSGVAGHYIVNRLLDVIEAERSTPQRVRLNGPRPLVPSDLPEEGKIEIQNASGEWNAFFFTDALNRIYDGSGSGESIEEACREALEDAE
jgi:hypothetical protein